ncbi:MAG: integrase core domain-containing protein, partial [Gemmataceae bacterium]|nr:integrase core domain-containing protein [Gemmataceae bacterium]
PAGPNESRAADITYAPPGEGRPYPAAAEALFSRMAVGWATAATMGPRPVADAVGMAITRRPGAGLLAHSGRGSRSASGHYQRVPSAGGLVCSMSGVGRCWDNAPVESFSGSPKPELAPGAAPAARDPARAAIFEYLEAFHNRPRSHSSLGFISPVEFERACNQTHR